MATVEPEQRNGMDTGLWAARSGFQVLVEARDYCFSQNVQTGSGAHSGSFSMRTPERAKREVDEALPTSIEVKNKWNYVASPYTPP
jgi:hypothetical protein